MTTALKLSIPQTQGLHEIYAKAEVSMLTTRKNTIHSLEKLNLIEEGEYLGRPAYLLTDAGKEAIGIVTYDEVIPGPEHFTQVLDSDGVTKTPNWADPVITEEEIVDFKAMAEKLSGVEDDALQAYTFDKDWAMWERELMGFGATIAWKNTQVWDGLTAEEIRTDMDTAKPINRAARREEAKARRKLLVSM